MGDNAKVNWGWHNNEVGHGYQAKHVIRQPGVKSNQTIKIIDKSVPSIASVPSKPEEQCSTNSKDKKDPKKDSKKEKKKDSKKEKKKTHKKKHNRKEHSESDSDQSSDDYSDDSDSRDKKSSKKKKESKKRRRDGDDESRSSNFNPLLQLLASRLSNKTMKFTEKNE